MRVDAQATHKHIPLSAWPLFVAQDPEHPTSERLFEVADRRHHYRIDELLMKLRITLVRIEAIRANQETIVEIHRIVECVTRGIVIDHFDRLAHRARGERLPRDAKDYFVYGCCLELL